MAFSLWTWACDQLKPTTGQQITLKKRRHLNEMYTWACKLYNGQRIPFLTAVNWP